MMGSQSHYGSPPPYSPFEDDGHENAAEEKSRNSFLPLSEFDVPHASTFTRGLQVPSRTAACTSGFDYPEELIQYDISKAHWQQFTQAICDEAKLSRQQWTTVVGKGLGTLAVGGLMVGFFSAIPAVLVTRFSRQHQEKRNLVAAMAGVQGERLSHHISHWNETFFRSRGVLIRVDLPDEYLDDLHDMTLHSRDASTPSNSKARDKAALKARIVIIPLETSTTASIHLSGAATRAE